MKVNWKYFVLLLFLGGCKGNTDPTAEEDLPLYPKPITVALNTAEGYSINKITGDSIKPLINSFGDTVKTGITFPFKGAEVDPQKISKPKIIKAGTPAKTFITSNVHPLPDKLETIPVDTNRLMKIKLGEGDRSFVLRNSTGIVPTGIPIPVTGKKIQLKEPYSIKALPMRSKDGATANIQYLDVDQGLSYSFIYPVLEDKKGNLWFGMDGTGITKYDGINITDYSVKEGLSNGTVTSILEDRKGNLWIGTYDGVNMFDGKSFTQFTEKEGLSHKRVWSIQEDKKGNLWFCTIGGGVTKYDGKNFTHYTRKEGLPCDTVLACIQDRNDNLWFGTFLGAAKFDGNRFTYYTSRDGLTDDYVFTMLEDKKGNIWFGSQSGGISKYDGKKITHYTVKEGLSNNTVWSLMEDKSENIWIGTSYGGINKFDGKKFTHFKLEQGLSNPKVRGITEDMNGNIWFGTDGGGINKLNTASFSYLIPEELMDNNRVRPILKDKKGNLWFGTEGGGVGKYDAESSVSGGRGFSYYKVKDGLAASSQRSILQDKKGNIWIGTTGGGISKYDGKNFTNYSIEQGLSDISIVSMLEDKRGILWLGTSEKGLCSYDGKNFTHYTLKEGLPADRIFSMLEDKKGDLWFCTEGGGISKYDGTYLINYTEREGLFSKSVTSITEDEDGNIWLGTLGAGVCKFDGKDFTYYTKQEGLSDNNVWSVLEDSAGHFWFGTDRGLTLFIPQKDSQTRSKNNYAVYRFGFQDGLKAIDFNLRSVCLDNDNHIWWGTGKGVPNLDLNIKPGVFIPRSLSLNFIEINDRFYDYRNFPDSVKNKIAFSGVAPFCNYPDDLTLAHDQNHLTFHFSAIDWSAPEKIKYSYRLVGLDERWSNPSEEATADYRNLSHGRYVFQVKAIGESQVWTQPIVYSFVIRPAWWQTWWFKSAIILCAALVLLFVSRLIYLSRLRKQRAIMEKQLAVQYERQRISSEMHDDIGAGLSGIKLMTEMVKTKSKDEGNILEIEKIYQSVGDISSKMKEVIWSLNIDNDKLSNLIFYIQKQARQWLENYPCQLTVEIPGQIPDMQISGEVRRNIFLVVKEAVHNIIKHSGADKVDISITCTDKLIISVSDNGKGMDAKQQNDTGNGMKNMQQRIRKLNGDFFITNQNGLTLTFKIPLKQTV